MARGRQKRTVYSPPPLTPRTRSGPRSRVRKETPKSLTKVSSFSNSAKRSTRKRKLQWHESDEERENYASSVDEIESDNDSVKDVDDEYEDDAHIEYLPDDASRTPEKELAFCPWAELKPNELPELILPESSSDLLIESNLLIPAVEVYETCFTYYRVIQLSPFLFEDFCCALRSPDQTRLMAEIHIAFLRLFVRDDEDNQTSFTVQDTNNSFNLMMQLLDGMTYAEVLRHYVESDPRFETNEIKEILRSNYPFVEVDKKITVLKWLCDRFVDTYAFKKLVKMEGKITADETCRDCGKPGDVILCDGCEACYHLDCTALQEVPSGNWFCPVCELHADRGALNLKDAEKGLKYKLRIESLGFDRHGRIYWFFAKRLFIQDTSGDVYYYSTLPQLYALISSLDSVYLEKALCDSLFESLDYIASEMALTLQITWKHRQNLVAKVAPTRPIPNAYLDIDNTFCMANIITQEPSNMPIMVKIASLLNIENGTLRNTFWAGELDETQLRDLHNRMYIKQDDGTFHFVQMKLDNLRRGYRLGFSDGGHRDYVNEYANNELSKNVVQRTKERDRRKYLSMRFSLVDEGDFSWAVPRGRDIYCAEAMSCKIIQHTLKKLCEKIPVELMHRLWPDKKDKYLEHLMQSTNAAELALSLLQYEKALRKPVFSSIWWNSLGQLKLIRTTSDDREKRTQLDARRKKEEKVLQMADPSENSDVMFVSYLKPRPSQYALWRLKDEGFRLNNRYQMGGWLWISSTFARDIRSLAKVPPLGVDCFTHLSDTTEERIRKAVRLDKVVMRLALWRQCVEQRLSGKWLCYSSMCRIVPLTTNYSCYNPNCPRKSYRLETTGKYKAFRNGVVPAPIIKTTTGTDFLRRSFLGEGRPFPFPKPFDFKSRGTGKRSLLILPQTTLRRLARQGGTNQHLFIPGFNKQAKSNAAAWNYPCPRPLFENCWRYSTLNAKTFHSLALAIRTMYACIRWSDMEPPDENDYLEYRVVNHFPDHDELRTVISHKEHPPDGYYEQYKIRVQILSIDDHDDYDDMAGPKNKKRKIRKGGVSVHDAQPRFLRQEDRWIDGVDLKLFEIRCYWARFNDTHGKSSVAPLPSVQNPPQRVLKFVRTPQYHLPPHQFHSPPVQSSQVVRTVPPRRFTHNGHISLSYAISRH